MKIEKQKFTINGNQKNKTLLRRTNSIVMYSILMFAVLLESIFSEGVQVQHRKPRPIILTEQGITCFDDTEKQKIHFTFQYSMNNLFQVIFQQGSIAVSTKPSKSPLGKPKGLRLIKAGKVVSEIFHDSFQKIQQARAILQRRINQIGFIGQFRPLKKIGKGSFGSVYLAERKQDGCKVAVKAFSKDAIASQPKGKNSLENEIIMMRKFDHRNIVKLLAVYQSENSVYMVMQAFEGGHLMDKFQDGVSFSLSQIKKIMHGILKGLAHMHAFRIMHRDIKPENLLFRKKGSLDQIALADFGLAANADAEQHLFVRCGTPGYVAPQVINIVDMSIKTDPICDVFSAGVIFHMLLLERPVFDGESYSEIVQQNRTCNFELEGLEYKQVNQNALSLLKKMLQVMPSDRITASQALKHTFFNDRIQRPISTKTVVFKLPPPPRTSKKRSSIQYNMQPIRLGVLHTKDLHQQQIQMIKSMTLENTSAVSTKSVTSTLRSETSTKNHKIQKGLRS